MNEESVKYTPEYKAIKAFYSDRCAERSGVPLIRHIDEGLDILEMFGATRDAMRSWCIHPLLQHNDALWDISENDILFSFSPRVVLLAMEYRARANDWLSEKVQKVGATNRYGKLTSALSLDGLPSFGVLLEVRDMLVADKIQNYKDFLEYHYGTHNRSEELNRYFLEWLGVLKIDEQEFSWICKELRKTE